MNIDKIVDVVDKGGLVISPTDTVYGIMGDSLNEDVIRKVYKVKKRPFSKPLILLMSSTEMIRKYMSEISELEEDIISEFLPGLVTIILRKNDKISPLVCNGSSYVGVRIPDNKDLIEIIEKLGRPVISTSANISDYDVITNVDMIDNDLRDGVDYIEDGGEIISESSTVIRIIDGKLEILRDGKMFKKVEEYFYSK